MREEEIKKALEEKFSELYGNTEGIRYFFAPGRVNLTWRARRNYEAEVDVFPCALSMGSYAAVKKREDKNFRFYSLNVEGAGVISAGEHDFTPLEDKQWAAYLKGVIWAMEKKRPGDSLRFRFGALRKYSQWLRSFFFGFLRGLDGKHL